MAWTVVDLGLEDLDSSLILAAGSCLFPAFPPLCLRAFNQVCVSVFICLCVSVCVSLCVFRHYYLYLQVGGWFSLKFHLGNVHTNGNEESCWSSQRGLPASQGEMHRNRNWENRPRQEGEQRRLWEPVKDCGRSQPLPSLTCLHSSREGQQGCYWVLANRNFPFWLFQIAYSKVESHGSWKAIIRGLSRLPSCHQDRTSPNWFVMHLQ